MQDLHLYLGNKNYSSWSFRPWIAMREKGIPFSEEVIPFDFGRGNPSFQSFSPSMKVPVLRHGDLTVWDSLAILEYVAELFPEKGFWPTDAKSRAMARAVSAEMHSGFASLRAACPMNMRRTPAHKDIDEDVRKDIARILNIWRQCLGLSGGPFLSGEFTIADAMFAPVVSRFDVYQLTRDPMAAEYGAAVKATEAWQEWDAAAREEPWNVPESDG